MTKEKLIAAGFSCIYIRDVPIGMPLTPEKAEQYPLKKTDSWLSEDGKIMLEKGVKEGKWKLMFFTSNRHLKIKYVQEGTLDELLEQIRQYYEK